MMPFEAFEQSTTSVPTVAIIGGGFSGAMVAMHLLRRARVPLSIYLIERQSQVGQGVAYSSPLDCHVMNVPVGSLRLMDDEDGTVGDRPDFLTWLREVAGLASVTAEDFVPRYWFGRYVQASLQAAIAQRHANVQISVIQDEAMQISVGDRYATLHLQRGQRLRVDRVVLALGNSPPASLPIDNLAFHNSASYIESGRSDALDSVLSQPSLLLAGMGLTAVDWVVALHQRGYTGTIHALSRRGLLPQVHRISSAAQAAQSSMRLVVPQEGEDTLLATLPTTVRELTQWIRQRVAIAQSLGYDWRPVFDSLRPYTQSLWQHLPLKEKRRFLRHLRPYWDSHRHRVAPQVYEVVQSLRRSGQLQLHRGQLQTCENSDAGVVVRFRPRGQTHSETLTVGAVINCTGAQTNYREIHHPLIRSLMHQGLMRTDALRLGLDAAPNGAVRNRNGVPSSWLYTLGTACRGQLWETTAIAEIRTQAAALATTLLLPQGGIVPSHGSMIRITHPA
ncbi:MULTISPECIES: FAD/NAD(P)-binding protein [unclassified Leptolyngbya]|uniref:FAD/NAD(P)-binding protein n=1 Tax=unclassified Leptolyngbya TaxID=2650499 RepID=UPI00168860D6|nr:MULTISPECIES: FAD/NAD(P)-binding protein [unclassified Leptolyngbya]MBD1910879.1 FAD/NAD(P)-binding protein [Leptolyngbya sp. FACHB-8]MBD2153726.1 FAD/NAD(P)-binding protein [Leptolyngbya sp. FACHB-16]